MKQISKNGIIRCHLNNFKNLAGLTFFLFFIAIISNVYAQEETKAMSFGIHAGVNIGGSNVKTGSSFSLHGAYSLSGSSMQLELMLFYDHRPDAVVIDRDNPSAVLETSAFGFALGARVNTRPHKNWNPSIALLMLGFASVKEHDRLFKENFSPALCLLFSNTLYQKHMISMGMHAYFTSHSAFNPDVRFSFNIKYGFWF